MSKYSIALANRQRMLRIDRRRLTKLVRSVLLREQVESAEISVAIVDDRQIHAINKRFLNHDSPTDVISFLLDVNGQTANAGAAGRQQARSQLPQCTPLPLPKRSPERRASRIVRRGAGKVIGGEVVLSAETALRAATGFHTNPQHELALYLVHGLLHLCGYDDLKPNEKRLMRRREAEALKDWKL